MIREKIQHAKIDKEKMKGVGGRGLGPRVALYQNMRKGTKRVETSGLGAGAQGIKRGRHLPIQTRRIPRTIIRFIQSNTRFISSRETSAAKKEKKKQNKDWSFKPKISLRSEKLI